MNFLDIIIPQYKEKREIIIRLLNTISSQKNIDFKEIGIIIVNDGSKDTYYTDLINMYSNLNIKYLINEKNIGSGPTRNVGLEESNAKYVTFVDSDDYIYGEYALNLVISCLKDTDSDVVQTAFIGEKLINGKLIPVKYKADYTRAWLHAKFIKREFLLRHNIRFSNELSNNFEDSYFCTLVTGYEFNKKKVIDLDYPTYCWCYNLDSITRRKRKYHYFVEEFSDFIKCPIITFNRLKAQEEEFAYYYLANSLAKCYIILMSDLFSSLELKDKRNEYINLLVNMYKENDKLFKIVGDNDFNLIYKSNLEELKNSLGIDLKIEDINDFLKDYNIH